MPFTLRNLGRAVTIFAIASLSGAGLASAGGFSAYATNEHGNYGYGTNYPSVSQAQWAALNGCAAGGCRIVMTTTARCSAYADSNQGGYWYGHAYGNSAYQVRSAALEFCRAGGASGCAVRHIACG
jgi:Domain of unknown function (DUF4189)